MNAQEPAMYLFLFSLAGLAIVGWALLILLPTWSITRKIADWALFPVFLAGIYVVGIVALLSSTGLGVVRDFGTADGVIGLLARPEVALVAWIHILAFDHLVGVFIYRDNMWLRVVPLPVQSVILFLTLMFGPVGFLSYYAIRLARRRAYFDRRTPGRAPTEADAYTGTGRGRAEDASDVATSARCELPRPSGPLPLALARALRELWSREPAVTAAGALGIALATALVLTALLRGSIVPPEGHLLETATFDGAVGIFVLTLAALAPLAGFTPRGRRRWAAWVVGLALVSYGIETVQAVRGLDPRFSSVAGPVDQAIGGLFFFIAQGILITFAVLAWKFFRRATAHLPQAFRLAVRYGAAAAFLAFMVGNVMSALGGRAFGAAGNLLPLHAAGFHGMQAVPLVALLLVWANVGEEIAARWTHLAGAAWLAACAAIAVQSFSGLPVLALSPWTGLAAAALSLWAGTLLFAAARVRSTPSMQPA